MPFFRRGVSADKGGKFFCLEGKEMLITFPNLFSGNAWGKLCCE